MTRIRAKLHSRRGASLMIALVLFLICTFVSTAVLVSASGNVQRPSKREEESRGYLAVAAAAELLGEKLAGVTFTAAESYLKHTCQYHTPARDEFQYFAVVKGVESGTGLDEIFNDFSLNFCHLYPDYYHSYTGASIETRSRSFTMAAPGMETVQGVVSMNQHFQIRIVLRSDASAYTLTLTLPTASKTGDKPGVEEGDAGNGMAEEESGEYCSYIREETYEDAESGTWGVHEVTYSFEKLRFTHTISVTWGEAVLTKGAA